MKIVRAYDICYSKKISNCKNQTCMYDSSHILTLIHNELNNFLKKNIPNNEIYMNWRLRYKCDRSVTI